MAYAKTGSMYATYTSNGVTKYWGNEITDLEEDKNTLGFFVVREKVSNGYRYVLACVRDGSITTSAKTIGWYANQAVNKTQVNNSSVITSACAYIKKGTTKYTRQVSTSYSTFVNEFTPLLDNWNMHITLPMYDESQLNTQEFFKYVNDGDDTGAKNYDELHASKCHFYVKNDGITVQFNYEAQLDEQHTTPSIDYYEVWALSGLGDMRKMSQSSGISSIASVSWSEFGLQHSARFYIRGIKNGQQKFELSCDCERKYLVFFGEVKTTIVVGEYDGHTLSVLASNKNIEDISTSEYSTSDSQKNRHNNDKFMALSSLVTCYRMGESQLASLGNWIYENDAFIEDIKLLFNNPMECLISLKYCPITIPVSRVTTVKLASIDTEIQGGLVSNTFYKRDIGSITVPTFSNGFLNYEPYTTISLFLPMAQKVTLSPQDVVGYTIDVDLIVDVICGTFAYCVYTNKGGGNTLIHTVSGSCSIDIPLTQSNRAQIENGYISALINTISQPLNPANAISNVIDSYTQQHHTNQFGGCSSMTGILQPNQCFIEIKYPVLSNPSKFAHTKGYMCMQDFTLESLSGFTKLASNIELKNLSFSKSGIDKLKTILTTGFYI